MTSIRGQFQTELLFLQQKLESTEKKLKLVSESTQAYRDSDFSLSIPIAVSEY